MTLESDVRYYRRDLERIRAEVQKEFDCDVRRRGERGDPTPITGWTRCEDGRSMLSDSALATDWHERNCYRIDMALFRLFRAQALLEEQKTKIEIEQD